MPVDQIQFNCPCTGCSTTLFTANRPAGVSEAAFIAEWKKDATDDGGHLLTCSSCECKLRTVDDTAQGAVIKLQDESPPRIDSLGATTSGSTSGGVGIAVTGHRFTLATPTVRVDGVSATNVVVATDANLTCDVPAGKVKLNIVEYYTKLAHGAVSGGPFQVGETVTGATSSATGSVVKQTASYLMVGSVSGAFQDGESVSGGTSSASATLSAAPDQLNFSVTETLTGITSAETAICRETQPLRVDTLSGSFVEEDVQGNISGAMAKLSATPMNGAVDVTVESSWGQRASGGTLTGGFTYTP